MTGSHPFTLHKTYTGPDCAICGRPQTSYRHDGFNYRLVDGDQKPIPEENK